MKKLLLNILLMSSFFVLAQDKAPTLPRFSIRANMGIPKATSSEAFRNSFSGVLTGDASMNCKIFSNFFVGAGYSYTYFKSQRYFRERNLNTNMQSHNGYMKIGFDKFFSDNGFATFALNAGYNYNTFEGITYRNDSLIGKYPTNFTSSFAEAVIGLYFIVDPNFAIGGHISYNYNFSQFNPKYPGFDKWFTYDKVRNNWNISMITLGFGFYYGLTRSK